MGRLITPESAPVVSVGKECRETVKCISCSGYCSGVTSGVRGDLSLVVNGFICMRCNGTIQETDHLVCKELLLSG